VRRRRRGAQSRDGEGRPEIAGSSTRLILIFQYWRTGRSVLCHLRGEEHLLLRRYYRGKCIVTAICTYSLPFLAALSHRRPPLILTYL
jgi:hypothetical protein